MDLIEKRSAKVMWAFRIDKRTKAILKHCADYSEMPQGEFVRELIKRYYSQYKYIIGPVPGFEEDDGFGLISANRSNNK